MFIVLHTNYARDNNRLDELKGRKTRGKRWKEIFNKHEKRALLQSMLKGSKTDALLMNFKFSGHFHPLYTKKLRKQELSSVHQSANVPKKRLIFKKDDRSH